MHTDPMRPPEALYLRGTHVGSQWEKVRQSLCLEQSTQPGLANSAETCSIGNRLLPRFLSRRASESRLFHPVAHGLRLIQSTELACILSSRRSCCRIL